MQKIANQPLPLAITRALETVDERLSTITEIEDDRGPELKRSKEQWKLIKRQLQLKRQTFDSLEFIKVNKARLEKLTKRVNSAKAPPATTTSGTIPSGGDTLGGTTLVESLAEATQISSEDESVFGKVKSPEEQLKELDGNYLSLSDQLTQMQTQLSEAVDEKQLADWKKQNQDIGEQLDKLKSQQFNLENKFLPKVWADDLQELVKLYEELVARDSIRYQLDRGIQETIYEGSLKLHPVYKEARQQFLDYRDSFIQTDDSEANASAEITNASIRNRLRLVKDLSFELATGMGKEDFERCRSTLVDILESYEQEKKERTDGETESQKAIDEKIDLIKLLWSELENRPTRFHRLRREIDSLLNDWRQHKLEPIGAPIEEKIKALYSIWTSRNPYLHVPVLTRLNDAITGLETSFENAGRPLTASTNHERNWLRSLRERCISIEQSMDQAALQDFKVGNEIDIEAFSPELSNIIVKLEAATEPWDTGKVWEIFCECRKKLTETALEFKRFQQSMVTGQVDVGDNELRKALEQDNFDLSSIEPLEDTALNRLSDARKLDVISRKELIKKIEDGLDKLEIWLTSLHRDLLVDVREYITNVQTTTMDDVSDVDLSSVTANVSGRLEESRKTLQHASYQRLITFFNSSIITTSPQVAEDQGIVQQDYTGFLWLSERKNRLAQYFRELESRLKPAAVPQTFHLERIDETITLHWKSIRQEESLYNAMSIQQQTEYRGEYIDKMYDSLKDTIENKLKERIKKDFRLEAINEEKGKVRADLQMPIENSARQRAIRLGYTAEKTEEYIAQRLKNEEASIQSRLNIMVMQADNNPLHIFMQAVNKNIDEKTAQVASTGEHKIHVIDSMIEYVDSLEKVLVHFDNANTPLRLHREMCGFLGRRLSAELHIAIHDDFKSLLSNNLPSLVKELRVLESRQQATGSAPFSYIRKKVEELRRELMGHVSADQSDIASALSTAWNIPSDTMRMEIKADPQEAKIYLKRMNDLKDEITSLIEKEQEQIRDEVRQLEKSIAKGESITSSTVLAIFGRLKILSGEKWRDVISSTLVEKENKSVNEVKLQLESAENGLTEDTPVYLRREVQILKGIFRECEAEFERIKKEIKLPLQISAIKQLVEKKAEWDSKYEAAKVQMQKVQTSQNLAHTSKVIKFRLDLLNSEEFKIFREEPKIQQLSEVYDALSKLNKEAEAYVRDLNAESIESVQDEAEQGTIKFDELSRLMKDASKDERTELVGKFAASTRMRLQERKKQQKPLED